MSEPLHIADGGEEKNQRKTAGVRCLGACDIAELKRRVLQLDDADWDRAVDYQINRNKRKASLAAVGHLILRFSEKSTSQARYFELPGWSQWESTLQPLMDAVTDSFGYQRRFYPRVMLARLPAGKLIPPHVDGHPRQHQAHKFHVPIQTNPQCHFYVAGRQYDFRPGQAYEVNNGALHAAANSGDTDRIHLIFECLDADLNPVRSAAAA